MTDVTEAQEAPATGVPMGEPIESPADGVEREAVLNPPPNPPQAVLQTEAAFLCYMDEQGHWVADDAAVNRPVQVARSTTFIDFHNAGTTIVKDIVVSETAQQVVALQQQVAQRMAQQMAEQQRTAAVAAQMGGPVGQGLDLSKLRTPGQ